MRRRFALGFLGACAAAAAGIGDARAELVTVPASKDNTLYEDAGGTLSNGSGPHLYVGRTFGLLTRRAVLAFDLGDAVPAGSVVRSATLNLYLSRSSPSGPEEITVHRLTADWGEGASNAGTPGGSGAPAQVGDATWLDRFFGAGSLRWTNPGGDFDPNPSAALDVDGPEGFFAFTSPALAADVQAWVADPASNFGWLLKGDEVNPGTAQRFESSENPIASVRPSLVIDFAPPQWDVDGGGSWSLADNWVGPVPGGAGSTARFADSLVAGAMAPAVVTLDGPRTVGTLVFDNDVTGAGSDESYVLAPGTPAGTLTLNAGAGGVASVRVLKGNHAITAPVAAASALFVDVAGGSTLRLAAGLSVPGGAALAKSGPGTLDVTGTLTLGATAPSVLDVQAGRIEADRVRRGLWHVAAGATLALKPQVASPASGGSEAEELTFDGPVDAPQGTLDLRDRSLVVRASSATREAVLAALNAYVRSGRNSGQSGLWSGQGLTSSLVPAGQTLAVVLNDAGGGAVRHAEFGGVVAGPNDVLVGLTWDGDANLDGRVDASDYRAIDGGFALGLEGFANGDFDYSGGPPDISDYLLIDASFMARLGALSASSPRPVPEPGALALLAPGLLAAARRRAARR